MCSHEWLCLNSTRNVRLFLEAAIEIKFDCLQPVGKLLEGDKGVYSFAKKPKYKPRKLEFASLIEFLKIPGLSHGSQEARTLARYDFYDCWGFLTGSNDLTKASENEATFDKWHIDLCELNEKRLKGKLNDADVIKFNTLGLIN